MACEGEMGVDDVDAEFFVQHQHRMWLIKISAAITLVLFIGGMLFYLFLFALQQSASNQRDWWRSFLMWMMMDALLLSTANVVLTHYLLPSFSKNEVRVAENELKNFILKHQDIASSDPSTAVTATAVAPLPHPVSTVNASFDSSEFFFVSKRVAREFPDLPESEWIQTYSTPWPRRSYANVKDVARQVEQHGSTVEAVVAHVLSFATVFVVVIFTTYVRLPSSVRELFTEMAATSAIGYSFMFELMLYRISPYLAAAPLLLILFIVWRIFCEHYEHQHANRQSTVCPESPSPQLGMTGAPAPERPAAIGISVSASSGPEIEAEHSRPDAEIMQEEEVIPRDQHGSDSEGASILRQFPSYSSLGSYQERQHNVESSRSNSSGISSFVAAAEQCGPHDVPYNGDIEAPAPRECAAVVSCHVERNNEVDNDAFEDDDDSAPSPMNSDYYVISSESSSSPSQHLDFLSGEDPLCGWSEEESNEGGRDWGESARECLDDLNSDIFSISSDEPSANESRGSSFDV